MVDPREDKNPERTVSSPEPDRIDSNEKADDTATVVDPDGTEVVEAIPSEEGRVR